MESYISAMMLLKHPVNPSGRECCEKPESEGQEVRVAQKITTIEVQAYLNEVKERFKDKKEDYRRFLNVIKGFQARSFDTPRVMLRIKKLFKEHPDLILGFNHFLPEGYEITLPKKHGIKKSILFGNAINFVIKVKARTKNNPFIYNSFLVMLKMHRENRKSITELNNEVAALFHDYPDLLDGFKHFQPKNSAKPTMLHAAPKNSAILSPDERSSTMPTSQHIHVDESARAYHANCNPSVERLDQDFEKAMLKIECGKGSRKDDRDARDLDHDNIHCHKDRSYHKNEENLVEEQTKKFQNLSICSPNDDKKLLESVYSQEFYEQIKEKLRNFDDYQKFLKYLSIYNKETISRSEMQSLIGDLLANPNLQDGFRNFLKQRGKIEALWREGDAPKPVMVQRNHEMDKDRERHRFDSNMGTTGQNVPFPSNEKYMENLGAEYHIIPPASQRSELSMQVVDDCWVSVSSGNDDFSFKHMPKNHKEESLFQYEDNKNHSIGRQNKSVMFTWLKK